MTQPSILVLGGGVFGATSALELATRGYPVTLMTPGGASQPHPRASSTDISKLVRMDYGADALYFDLMAEALGGWRRWLQHMERPLFHETGLSVLRRTPALPGSFEHDSLERLRAREQKVVALSPPATQDALPRLHPDHAFYGYINHNAGWAESGAVVAWLHQRALAAGVRFVDDQPTTLEDLDFDRIVVATGAWTPSLLPELGSVMEVVGQPVLHFAPEQPERFAPPHFLPWTVDIATTGWYGFAANAQGIVKVANHGTGISVHPDDPDHVPESWDRVFRAFLGETFPELASAPIVGRRLCLYCDTWDGDFYITPLPGRPEIVLATGGSGHGFKFAPVLGKLVAHCIEGQSHPALERFAWRERGARRTEHARFFEV